MIHTGQPVLSAAFLYSLGGRRQGFIVARNPTNALQLKWVRLSRSLSFVESYRSLPKDCTTLVQAKQVHADLAKNGRDDELFLGEPLVNTFVKCGSLKEALDVFWGLPYRTVVSWTAVISVCTNAGQSWEALRMYQLMVEEGVKPNSYTFVSLLKACGSLANLGEGKRIHVEATKYGCVSNLFVGTSLVDMYAKCGSMPDAQLVFDSLSQRDVVMWTAMITGYIHQGEGQEALMLYQRMLREGVEANSWTYLSVVKACGSVSENEDVDLMGKQMHKVESWQLVKAIHAEIQGKDYLLNDFVRNALVTVYARCGSIADSRIVFNGMSRHVVVSWNAMLAAYAQQQFAEDALELYLLMSMQSISPDARTLVSILQASCSFAEKEEFTFIDGQSLTVSTLQIARELHAEAWRRGYDSNVFICSTLITLYSTCGSIVDAQNVFSEVPHLDVVSLNSMMVAFSQQGQADQLLSLYTQRLEEGISPDERTLVVLVQACSMIIGKRYDSVADGQMMEMNPLHMGKVIHAEAWRRSYMSNMYIGSSLINIYGKYGSILDAQNVFCEVSKVNVMTCSAMLGTYIQQRDADRALQLYGQMLEAGLIADDHIFVIVLQACSMLAEREVDVVVDGVPTKVESLEKGKVIHAEGWKAGYASNHFFVSSLIHLYGNCGRIVDIQNLLDGLSQRDVISWNALLSAYSQHGQADKALQAYLQMIEEGLLPDDRTFASMFQACGILVDLEEGIPKLVIGDRYYYPEALQIGKILHGEAWKKGYKSNVFVGSSLVSMYAKCMSIADAENVFHDLSKSNIVLWNAMLAAYLHHSQPQKAWQLYGYLREVGLSPDDRTFVSALQACGMLAQVPEKGASEQPTIEDLRQDGETIHAEAWKCGYKSDPFVCNALISMYGKVGNLVAAQEVFDGMSHRNVVSWNAILATYAQQGQPDRTLKLYGLMRQVGETPDDITFVCILGACCTLGSLGNCVNIHHDIVCSKSRLSSLVATVLIHAYGRCASMLEAQKVFNGLPEPKLISWNALMAGYARQGNWEECLLCYKAMLLTGERPDGVTFLSIMYSCGHAGMVKEGIECFESMSRDYSISPEIYHYACMVDLLGRAGYFTAIGTLLSHMPIQPTSLLWLCVLAACRIHGNVLLAKHAFDRTVYTDPQEAAAYVLMSNIYAQAGMWDCARNVNQSRQEAGAWKASAETWIEYGQTIHTFRAGDKVYPLLYCAMVEIHALSREQGTWATQCLNI